MAVLAGDASGPARDTLSGGNDNGAISGPTLSDTLSGGGDSHTLIVNNVPLGDLDDTNIATQLTA